MGNINLPLGSTIVDHGSYSHVFNLLQRVDCSPTCLDTVLSACDDLFNCRYQSEAKKYFNPVLTGDKFMFQTRFYDDFNADDENPAVGWTSGGAGFVTAELLDVEGNLITDDHTLFASRYLVGYDGAASYQLIEIDVDLMISNFPEIDCFSFKFVAYDDTNTEVDDACSEHFKYYASHCSGTILISSTTSVDCCQNYYGTSVNTPVGTSSFKYSNQWRYYANIHKKEIGFTKTGAGKVRTKVEIDEGSTLQLTRMIPTYLFTQLVKVHLAGQKVFIDGEEYVIDEPAFENETTSCDMFIGKFASLIQECDINYNCDQ
jgi:hypothetical protein